MKQHAGGPAPVGRAPRKYRCASVAPVVLILALIALFTTVTLARLATAPEPAHSLPENHCLPTAAGDCGCTDDDTTGMEFAEEQQEYREEQFTHDGVSSTYRVFTNGVDPTLPVGAVIRLHGDGAYEYENSDTLVTCLAAVASAHNMIMVQPLTPSEDRTWWTDLIQNTRWLEALHQERILPEHEVASDQVWWMGYSGGAEMISYGLLPYAGETVSGGAIMIGGGGAPNATSDTAVPTERRGDLRLHWATGRRDDGEDPAATFDARTASREGAQFYRDLGFGNVTTDFERDDDHFTIDSINILSTVLEESDPR